MDRRRFLSYSGSVVTTLSGCLDREQADQPDATSDQTVTHTDQTTEREQTETTQPTETTRPTGQHLVLVNVDDEQRRVHVTVSASDDDVFDRTVDVAADERQRFLLDVAEPGTYTISATVDGDVTDTWAISFEDYDIQEGSDVFVEIDDGQPDIYWEE